MMGQGLLPAQYHPIVDLMSDDELHGFLDGIRQQVKKRVENFPPHTDFIAHYCPSAVV
jgi:tryptophan halogenase